MAQLTATMLTPNEPSICIPRVDKSFNDGQIIEGIQQLGYGEVENVDMIHKTAPNGVEYYMTFVHFKKWNTDEDTTKQRHAFMRGEKEKVVYDEETGSYWVLGKSFTKRREERGKKFQQTKYTKPYVDNDGWTNIPMKKR